jgi:hypothetical protein
MNAAQIPFPRCPATVHIGALALGAKAAAIGVIVGYLHTAPNLDSSSLSTGSLNTKLFNANSTTVDVGNECETFARRLSSLLPDSLIASDSPQKVEANAHEV